MRRFLLFFLLIIIVLILFSGFFWLWEAKYFVGRANVSQISFSVDNSYIFITPLKAKAGGQEKIRLTVFTLNNQGLGVLGKRVELTTNPSLTMTAVQNQTDSFGKAVFDISSKSAGDFYLEVRVDKTLLPQKAHLAFY